MDGENSLDVTEVSGVDSTPLDLSDDLFDVKSELSPTSANWKSIGIALRLNPNVLDCIQAGNNSDPTACLTSMVIEWLKRNYNVKKFGEPTWQQLVEVVGHPAGGANKALARDIAGRHKARANNIIPAGQRSRKAAPLYARGAPVELLWQLWYHKEISREKAEQRLENVTNGSFLVRESESKPGCFSLSLKHPGGITHFAIEKKMSGLYEVPGTGKGFTSLPDLVNYFKCHPISENPHHQLISPCCEDLHVDKRKGNLDSLQQDTSLKRVTLVKDPKLGIGCTIKNAVGHILVNRIVMDGPVAHTGALRPGDEIVNICGTTVTGLEVAEVAEVIKSSPKEVQIMVIPITAVKKRQKADTSKVTYSELLLQESSQRNHNDIMSDGPTVRGKSSCNHLHPRAVHFISHNGSLDNVGSHDKDEDDLPPPLPPKPKDAIVQVNPPLVMASSDAHQSIDTIPSQATDSKTVSAQHR